MNAIVIDTQIYKGAEIYAKMHNISIKELVEKAILNIVGQKTQSFKLKKEDELSPEIRSLIGIAKPSATNNDVNGRDARMEYISEKYTV